MIITAKAPSLSFMLIPYRGPGEAVTWTPFVAGGGEEIVGEVGLRAVPDYEEFIGAKKHLVLGSLSYIGPPQGKNSVAIG
jgi:hypothetical protein